jgi:hypothetical protein
MVQVQFVETLFVKTEKQQLCEIAQCEGEEQSVFWNRKQK